MTNRILALMIGAALGAGTAYGQMGQVNGGSGQSHVPCQVTRLRLRIGTGSDDLRGGQDNLNIIIFFSAGPAQVAANVNQGHNWPNNSVNSINILLSRTVRPDEIKALRLVHIADASFSLNLGELLTPGVPIALAQAFQSPDNWNMNALAVAAIGSGGGVRIANYGFHRFTGSDPTLTVATTRPATHCPAGELNTATGGSGPRLSMAGGRSVMPGLNNADMLRMVRSGAPDSATVAKVRSTPANFDVSPATLEALQRQGVSPEVLNTMVIRELLARKGAEGGRGGAVALNPQPYPPRGALLGAGAPRTLLGAPANPGMSPGSTSALIPAVQRPAITDGTRPGAPMIGASRIMSAPGFARGGRMAAMQRSPSLDAAAQCARNATRRIVSVSNSAGSPVRVLAPGQPYTIRGCSFGAISRKGDAALLLPRSAGDLFRIELNVISWTDQAIVVSFPSDPAYLADLRQYGGATSGLRLTLQILPGADVSLGDIGYSTVPQ